MAIRHTSRRRFNRILEAERCRIWTSARCESILVFLMVCLPLSTSPGRVPFGFFFDLSGQCIVLLPRLLDDSLDHPLPVQDHVG